MSGRLGKATLELAGIGWEDAVGRLGYSAVEIGEFRRKEEQRLLESAAHVERELDGFLGCERRLAEAHVFGLLERGLVYGLDFLRELLAHVRTLRAERSGVKS